MMTVNTNKMGNSTVTTINDIPITLNIFDIIIKHVFYREHTKIYFIMSFSHILSKLNSYPVKIFSMQNCSCAVILHQGHLVQQKIIVRSNMTIFLNFLFHFIKYLEMYNYFIISIFSINLSIVIYIPLLSLSSDANEQNIAITENVSH